MDSNPAGSEPTFQDSFIYHCVPTLIPVYPAFDPFLDHFYPRLRYCVVYPNAVRCMGYIHRFHSNVPPLFLAAKSHPTPGSCKTRRTRSFYCKEMCDVYMRCGAVHPYSNFIPSVCIPSSSIRFILCCLNVLILPGFGLKAGGAC